MGLPTSPLYSVPYMQVSDVRFCRNMSRFKLSTPSRSRVEHANHCAKDFIWKGKIWFMRQNTAKPLLFTVYIEHLQRILLAEACTLWEQLSSLSCYYVVCYYCYAMLPSPSLLSLSPSSAFPLSFQFLSIYFLFCIHIFIWKSWHHIRSLNISQRDAVPCS